MTYRHLFGLCLLVVLLASCAENKPPGNTGGGGQVTGATPTVSGGNDPSLPPEDPIPPGAQYTLSCRVYGGPDHMRQAEQAKLMMRVATKWNDWHVVHTGEDSTLMFGYYRSYDDKNDAAEYNRAQADRQRVVGLRDDIGNPCFTMVLFVPLDTSDPPAPKEWELAQCPGFWTLLVAAYRDSPLRKQYAVDAVRDARKMGLDAYYHHGPVRSEVYIGHWPREAVKAQDAAGAHGGDPQEMLIASTGGMPPGFAGKTVDANGHRIKMLTEKLEFADPTLQAAIAKYPLTWVNGVVLGRKYKQPDGSTRFVPTPSFLIQVPRASVAGETPQPPSPELLPLMPDLPSAPGADHLRSIGG